MDKIIIKNAGFLCSIGIEKNEREKKQEILIDLTLFTDIKHAAKTDNINNSVNYAKVYDLIEALVHKMHYNLIESLAESISQSIIENFKITKVLVKIKKPGALAHKNVGYTAVEIERNK